MKGLGTFWGLSNEDTQKRTGTNWKWHPGITSLSDVFGVKALFKFLTMDDGKGFSVAKFGGPFPFLFYVQTGAHSGSTRRNECRSVLLLFPSTSKFEGLEHTQHPHFVLPAFQHLGH